MVAMEHLVQNYKGGTASFAQCGAANPAVVQAALAIISGEGRANEQNQSVERPNVLDARSPNQDIGRA